MLGVRQRCVLRNRHRLMVHHVGHTDVVDPVREVRLRLGRARRAGQEPADEGEPDAADDVIRQRPQRHSARDHQITAEPTEPGREARGPVAVPVSFHAMDRAMRPPSSGNAGIRLKASSRMLIEAR